MKKLGLSILSMTLALTGCGPQAFQKSDITAYLNSPGHFKIPAKVDILFAEDNTGSIMEAFDEVESELPTFLNWVQNSGWDHHFATTPLATVRNLDQIVTSQYDTNWGSSWMPPFPGASINDPNLGIPSWVFQFPSQYTGFLNQSDVNLSLNGWENGFKTIHDTLLNETPGTEFLRNDALLVVIVLGNGNDTSNLGVCYRQGDGLPYFCEQNGPSGVPKSVQEWADALTALKGNDPMKIRFFSAVAHANNKNCLGGSKAIKGTRYLQMADLLKAGTSGNQSYEFCPSSSNSNSIKAALHQVLEDMAVSLVEQRLAYVQEYLVINGNQSTPPDVETIQMYVERNGIKTFIPRDNTNGWSWHGWNTEYTITSPTQLNQMTGWMLKLNGNAILVGDDKPTVTYKLLNGSDAAF